MHLRARNLGLVFVGGALGTGLRAAVGDAAPLWRGVPAGVLAVNVVGAFVLGLLLQRLQGAGPDGSRAGPEEGRRRDLRLLLGTGVLGGFTTYSALATDTVGLVTAGRPGAAVSYAAGTLVLGLAAALVGLRCGGLRSDRR